ncbi:MAG: hypothetical protein JNJ45_11500 [Chthonomonas sp.]|nr:hypothetical protein [Chthonomonas sp.]
MKKFGKWLIPFMVLGMLAGCSGGDVNEADVKQWQQSEDDKKMEAEGKVPEGGQPDR